MGLEWDLSGTRKTSRINACSHSIGWKLSNSIVKQPQHVDKKINEYKTIPIRVSNDEVEERAVRELKQTLLFNTFCAHKRTS